MSYVKEHLHNDVVDAFLETEKEFELWEMPDQRIVINEIGRSVKDKKVFFSDQTIKSMVIETIKIS